MPPRSIFLLLYLVSACFGSSSQQIDATCNSTGREQVSCFLQCAGLPASDTGKEHMRNLKSMLEAAVDLYTFMRSSASGAQIILEGALFLDPHAEPFHNEALVEMWMEVKMRPLLKSINRHVLACLSTKNLSCATYQTMVKEFSHYFSEMIPARQKWIYSFFMYPFLSREGINGCVNPNESSEEWLMKNFGAFSVMARIYDFPALNMVFRGLEVLHLLSPEQKAELLLRPEVAGLTNDSISLVFHSLMMDTYHSGWNHNWTEPGIDKPPYEPNLPASPHNTFREAIRGLTMAAKPIGSLIHNFVTLTKQNDVSAISSSMLIQMALNWTLAEIASHYTNTAPLPALDSPNSDEMNAWYKRVVLPVLRRFSDDDEYLMGDSLMLVFYHIFELDQNTDHGIYDVQDICSVTLDGNPCGLTDVVENVAQIMHCAARNQLTMSEENIMKLILELTERLNLLIQEFATANFTEVASDFHQILSEADSPGLTAENLRDPKFVTMWFYIKLSPLLPYIPTDLLSCLSSNSFSCPAYQTLVALLSGHLGYWDFYSMPHQNIYTHFISPFLWHQNMSETCFSANNSKEWLQKNFGAFSQVANITDFYDLNPYFSGLEVLDLLSPKQTAQLMVLPLPTPPEKEEIVREVFDFLLEAPRDRMLTEVLYEAFRLATRLNVSCAVYKPILEELQDVIASVPPDMESVVRQLIEYVLRTTPEECVLENIKCLNIQVNADDVCKGINSSDLHLALSASSDVPCNFSLEEYACAQLENFTANQLASLLLCDLPGDSKRSIVLWKVLLSKLSNILDPALDILASMPENVIVASAPEILDVIADLRLALLSDEDLNNSSVLVKWFSARLKHFLPWASPNFLRCLSNRNLSCQSYQQILEIFKQAFDDIPAYQQFVILSEFILNFLSRPFSGPGCLLGFNNSAEWLMANVGVFSEFLTLEDIFQLNPDFTPLEALSVLSEQQQVDLLFSPHPSLPETNVIIDELFDHLTGSPEEVLRIPRFLRILSNELRPPYGRNLSCSSYQALFARLDLAVVSVPLHVASSITSSKLELAYFLPPGCNIYSGECTVTPINETEICVGVNTTELQHLLDNGTQAGRFCDFALEQIACASLTVLTAEDLAAVFLCERSADDSRTLPVWKLLLSKSSYLLNQSLDIVANMSFNPWNPATSVILDAIREVQLDIFPENYVNDPDLVGLWFNRRLRPFLHAVSPDFLSCLITKDLNCTSFQQIVRSLSHVQPNMSLPVQVSVFTRFIKIFLTRKDTDDPGCTAHSANSSEWLQLNLGAFSHLAQFRELQMLHSTFSAFEALPLLTVRQLADLSSTPGLLNNSVQVAMVMQHVSDQSLPAFFDDFSPTALGHEYPTAVRAAMLDVVFDRAGLSEPSVNDSVVSTWLQDRLPPLLIRLSPRHVSPFFQILTGKNCSVERQGVKALNFTISTLSEVTQDEVHDHIIQALEGSDPLRCYSNNQSYFRFLETSFLEFRLPNLTTFLSLIPSGRLKELVNTMTLSELGSYLRQLDNVDTDALCSIFSNYLDTPMFLEKESLPANVRRATLPCVWPIALSSSTRSEVEAWFDRRLVNYLNFLTRDLVKNVTTYNTSCLAFQNFVSVLGTFNFSAVDFVRRDVYDTINTYLNSASEPRCYDPSDPELNSTAWFAEYIGPFVEFVTLRDLLTFGSTEVLQVFTVDHQNIAIFNQTEPPVNVSRFYTELLYTQDSNFNPLFLPLLFRCFVPAMAFMQLSPKESMIILQNLTNLCTDLDPQVSVALAGNLGDEIDAAAIVALGKESRGISVGDLKKINPMDLYEALGTLRIVGTWRIGQAKAIIGALLSSGVIQINNATSLLSLGTLSIGVPSNTMSNIEGSDLITASQDPMFLTHFMNAPQVIRQVFVRQIISGNSDSNVLVENVPDDLGTEIPGSLLLDFRPDEDVLTRINKKKWKREQASLFFEVIAAESATTLLGSADNLSSSVLIGFTCTSVRNLKQSQVRKLIRACRRSGENRVKLVETQLTCMYNIINNGSDISSFGLYPPDMLLYYNYSLVPPDDCRSYFQELSEADFSVFSPVLAGIPSTLFENAKDCLGITSPSLTEDNISVLGNMCCTLNDTYITDSDESILGKLQNCPELSPSQVAGVEALLESGKTAFGPPSNWTMTTLDELGMLPLFMTSSFYDNFDRETKRSFLEDFLKVLRENGVDKQKRKGMRREIRKSIRNIVKRSLDNECRVGYITAVTISDETFPFDYDDVDQFDCCLNASVVRDNLGAITEKVDQDDFLGIVLKKLREAYASHSEIPEDQVELLRLASRQATSQDIDLWSITLVDTLSSLLDPSNGPWNTSLAKQIISKYLNHEGNTLGTTELNAIGGENLCSLNVDVLQNITAQSLRDADPLNVSICALEKKQTLFNIALEAFGRNTRSTVSAEEYQLMERYLGGASLSYIRTLADSSVNMNAETFTSLNPDVVKDLTVVEVGGLLGSHLPDLKLYENQELVREWIGLQRQSDLETLGIGLSGGRADPTDGPTNLSLGPTTAPSGPTNAPSGPTNAPSGPTNAPSGPTNSPGDSNPTTSKPPHSNGPRVKPEVGVLFLFTLRLLLMSF